MFRWILGGRETQGSVDKSAALVIGEEQPRNLLTEMQVLKGHFDIVRFLLQIDERRFASAGDDGLVLVWSVETGECLMELRGHTQQITAMTSFPVVIGEHAHTRLITASSDRTLSLWDPDSGHRVQHVSDLQSSVKCLLVLECVNLWISGGNELCVWSPECELQCRAHHHSDTGISSVIELPKSFVAAAMDREIVIFRLRCGGSGASVTAVRHLAEHQDTVRSLISVSDTLFASGSHIGEIIVWDALDWTIQAYELILWEESARDSQSEARLTQQKPVERSVQHMSSDGQVIAAAVGSGLYVYDVQKKSVLAYRRVAHDSNVLHTLLTEDGRVMSCSEDGSVRMWELQDLPLQAEPASSGFFGMFGTLGRSGKQACPPAKRIPEACPLRSLELLGDLIGHSGAVQMFVSFPQKGVVTCSADHLLVVWRDGEQQSQRRSLALFQKLEEQQGL